MKNKIKLVSFLALLVLLLGSTFNVAYAQTTGGTSTYGGTSGTSTGGTGTSTSGRGGTGNLNNPNPSITPGTPNTGDGGNTAVNLAILLTSGAIAVSGVIYLIKGGKTVKA